MGDEKTQKDDALPVLRLAETTYKGVVTYCFELPEIEKMEIRDDDIWVCSFPRSGTTLTQELTYLIATGDFDTAKSVELDDRFPIIDVNDDRFPYYRGLKHFVSMKTQRFVKTHLHYFLLPEKLRQGKGKILYITRNPKDSIHSLYKLLLWLRQNDGLDLTFEAFFEMFMKGEGKYEEERQKLLTQMFYLTGAQVISAEIFLSLKEEIFKEHRESLLMLLMYAGPWWTHVREYWEHRNDKNLLFLKYEDVTKDLSGAVRQIAEFLGKPLTDTEVDKIADHCSLKNMRNNKMTTMYYQRKLRSIDDTSGGFINKGVVGSWRDVLTEDMSRRVDEMFQRELADTGLTYE